MQVPKFRYFLYIYFYIFLIASLSVFEQLMAVHISGKHLLLSQG